jgi:hypothetical protein
MHDAARIVDARPSIQSGKFHAGMVDPDVCWHGTFNESKHRSPQ